MDRALYEAALDVSLYQVERASDDTTKNIGRRARAGMSTRPSKTRSVPTTTRTITELMYQSPEGNNLTIEQGGGAYTSADVGAVANALPITIGGKEAYGLDITSGTGYRDDDTRGLRTGEDQLGTYMVASGSPTTSTPGRAVTTSVTPKTNNHDNGVGHMDAVNLTTYCGNNNASPSAAAGG